PCSPAAILYSTSVAVGESQTIRSGRCCRVRFGASWACTVTGKLPDPAESEEPSVESSLVAQPPSAATPSRLRTASNDGAGERRGIVTSHQSCGAGIAIGRRRDRGHGRRTPTPEAGGVGTIRGDLARPTKQERGPSQLRDSTGIAPDFAVGSCHWLNTFGLSDLPDLNRDGVPTKSAAGGGTPGAAGWSSPVPPYGRDTSPHMLD